MSSPILPKGPGTTRPNSRPSPGGKKGSGYGRQQRQSPTSAASSASSNPREWRGTDVVAWLEKISMFQVRLVSPSRRRLVYLPIR